MKVWPDNDDELGAPSRPPFWRPLTISEIITLAGCAVAVLLTVWLFA